MTCIMEKEMSDLVPIRVEYSCTTTAGGEESYLVECEVAVSELTDILRQINDHIDGMTKHLKTPGYTQLSMVPEPHRVY